MGEVISHSGVRHSMNPRGNANPQCLSDRAPFSHLFTAYKYSPQTLHIFEFGNNTIIIYNALNDNSGISKGRGILVVT